MSRLKSTVPTSILSGWKEIANHLGKGVRTVQRYEFQLALPIRRPGGMQGPVIATTAELDAWVSASPVRESFALRRQVPDNGLTLADFKTVLSEHRRLREEMAIFRGEMHTAMQDLRKSVKGLQAQHVDESTHRSGVLMLPDGEKQRPN